MSSKLSVTTPADFPLYSSLTLDRLAGNRVVYVPCLRPSPNLPSDFDLGEGLPLSIYRLRFKYLRNYPTVYYFQNPLNELDTAFVVPVDDIRDPSLCPLFIEGIPLLFHHPGVKPALALGYLSLVDPLLDHCSSFPIDLTNGLTAAELDRVRHVFPWSVGIRLNGYGVISILISPGYEPSLFSGFDYNRFPETLGGWAYQIEEAFDIRPTSGSVSHEITGSASLGIKIHLKNQFYLTSVTHAFIPNLSTPTKVVPTLSNWLANLSWFPRISTSFDTIVKYIGGSVTSLGRPVYCQDSEKQIGIVARTYDEPSALLPFPTGYFHDLSLIGSMNPTNSVNDVPNIEWPIQVPPPTSFASFSEAQKSPRRRIFCVNPCQYASNTKSTSQEAIIIGRQYQWRNANEDVMLDCLLWRTLGTQDKTKSKEEPNHLVESLSGSSGSVLCLTDNLAHLAQDAPSKSQTSAVIGFQSLESVIEVKGSKDSKNCGNILYQGSFSIPDEVMTSTICQVDI